MILQTYVNHGGKVFKVYHINNNSIIYLRNSLPDFTIDLVDKFEEFKLGFYYIHTPDLFGSNYELFLKKIQLKFFEINNNNHHIIDYLKSITNIFEKFSRLTLFGLDFLFDSDNNTFYLVDANNFPGYKELYSEFNDIIIQHIQYYYSIFQKNSTIFDY